MKKVKERFQETVKYVANNCTNPDALYYAIGSYKIYLMYENKGYIAPEPCWLSQKLTLAEAQSMLEDIAAAVFAADPSNGEMLHDIAAVFRSIPQGTKILSFEYLYAPVELSFLQDVKTVLKDWVAHETPNGMRYLHNSDAADIEIKLLMLAAMKPEFPIWNGLLD